MILNSIHYKHHQFGIGMVVCCWNCNRVLFIQTKEQIESKEIIYMVPYKERSRHKGFRNELKREHCLHKLH